MKTDEANCGKAKAVTSSWQFPRRRFGGQQMPQHWELALFVIVREVSDLDPCLEVQLAEDRGPALL